MDDRAASIDPVTLEIIREGVITIVREMRGNMLRAAYSSAVCEMHDMSCAVLDHEGQLIALSEGDNPQHIFPILWSVAGVMEKFKGDINPGDIFLHNDPLTGGTHLNDIGMIAPLFLDGKLAFFPVVRVHFEDVGGMSPGSITAAATETMQEGLRIPVVRAFSRGVINQDLFDVFLSNMRVPNEREGDFEAMLGTCRVAQRRLEALVAEHGRDTQVRAVNEMIRHAERRMRDRISQLPDGTYSYETAMDPRGAQLEPLVIRTTVTISGSSLKVDFTGTSPQNAGPWNLGPSGAPTGVFMVLKALLDRHGPVNSGTFRPLVVHTPPGSILNPTEPVGFGGMGDIRRNLEMSIMGALAPIMPGHVTGETKSTANQVIVSGINPATDRPFIFYEAPTGGTGGFLEHDGNSALRTFLEGDFGSLQSIESIEAKFPLRAERLSLRADSGGAGTNRGGLGFDRYIRFLGPRGRLTVLSDRNVLPPYGVEGGFAGAPNQFSVLRGGREIAPSNLPGKVAGFELQPDDVVIARSSGGGGFGDPLLREPSRVMHDVEFGYVSPGHAGERYGVVVKDGRLDEGETSRARKKIAETRVKGTVELEPELRDVGGMRPCYVSEWDANALRLSTGDVAELVSGHGAPFRCWVRVMKDRRKGVFGLSADSLQIFGVPQDTDLELRSLGVDSGAAREVWRHKLEALS